ncbi:MAG: hypothetical protein ACE5FS_12945 [Paracoccaceae bacterium]
MRLAVILGFALTMPLHAAAFWSGAGAWLGFGPVSTVLLFFICSLTPGVGGLGYMTVAFQGAVSGWGWPLWAAGIMILPAACFTAFVLIALSAILVVDRVSPDPAPED